MDDHDITLEVIVTPREGLCCRSGSHARPGGLLRDRLPDRKIAAAPLLQRPGPGG